MYTYNNGYPPQQTVGYNMPPQAPYGAQPYGVQPYGVQPYGVQPYGVQPYGAQPYTPSQPLSPGYMVSPMSSGIGQPVSMFGGPMVDNDLMYPEKKISMDCKNSMPVTCMLCKNKIHTVVTRQFS
jgi:hypothetical protein